jgi:hypothetical protein
MDEKTSGAQICMRRADTVQLHAQEIDEPTRIRIVVQRDPRAALLAMRAHRGTGGSNSLPSSEESAANSVQTLPPWRLPQSQERGR